MVTYSGVHSCIGQNNYHYWVSKALYDNLMNFAGNGVEDPRADKIIPWGRSVKSETTPAEVKWSADGKWRRSLPVDLTTSIIKDGGPRYDFAFKNGAWVPSGSCPADRVGDTLYIRGRVGYFSNSKDPFYRTGGVEESAISGAFHLRADSPSVMASYAEACLIKAEVLFNKGDKQGAYQAYKDGVKANIDYMNGVLAFWRATYPNVADCPSFTNMETSDIDAFINKGLGSASDLTLAKIMTQKQIIYLLTLESWNDMRRYDYDPKVFMNFAKSYNYLNTPAWHDYLPTDKAPRRWKQASYELNYNSANLEAIGSQVAGASSLPVDGENGVWYNSKQIGTLPVWWDSTQE